MTTKRPVDPGTVPFSAYSGYISELKRLARQSHSLPQWDSKVVAALDGQASRELRRLSPIETRRKFGTFFTGTQLAAELLKHGGASSKKHIFYDPTCGMGDLLLAAAKTLSLESSLPKTLNQWGQQLMGTDLHREFIDGAKARLVLLARQRHIQSLGPKGKDTSGAPVSNAFPYIRVADGLQQDALYQRATHLLLNPPFGKVDAPANCKWAGGRVTEAASFVISALERSRSGTAMLAILPDVLRSGSFSQHWRDLVDRLSHVRLVEPYGVFDDNADVDVFLLNVVRSDAERDHIPLWVTRSPSAAATIAHHFEVHVGRVVPHRDKEAGPLRPYIHPLCVPVWTTMTDFPERRQHEGLAYKPPFVVIRRTSRPGHQYRATATVIDGTASIFVENHLIVCIPKDGNLATCADLMHKLKTPKVNAHLDARIRCRHLTVGAVEAIPFEPEHNGH